jgi:hypothetical protein
MVNLGPIDLPEGVLVLLDPGLARFWRHDGPPRSPRPRDPEEWDLAIVGPDAVEAGKAYDRQWNPRFLYDVRRVKETTDHFAAFARERGFDARAEVLPTRVPHTTRVREALADGNIAVVPYNHLWSVVIGGLPSDRPLEVVGEVLPAGEEFAGRWRWIDVVVDASARVARTESMDGVMAEHGQILFTGLSPLGHFRMWESLDGLADFVFRGPDAEAVARRVGAATLDGEYFGWLNLPEAELDEHARSTQDLIEREKLKVGVDYRPHCNLERLNAQARSSQDDWGRLTLGGARVVGGGNRWGDGIFTVSRLFDRKDRLVRVRVELGNEKRQQLTRRVFMPHLMAIATRAILDDGRAHPLHRTRGAPQRARQRLAALGRRRGRRLHGRLRQPGRRPGPGAHRSIPSAGGDPGRAHRRALPPRRGSLRRGPRVARTAPHR